jgi:exodeoxyribonuclease VII small subunit
MAEKKEPAFEEAMGELESIVAQLEQGELPLEESMRLYERGVALTALCNGQLKSAKLRVEELKKPQDE